ARLGGRAMESLRDARGPLRLARRRRTAAHFSPHHRRARLVVRREPNRGQPGRPRRERVPRQPPRRLERAAAGAAMVAVARLGALAACVLLAACAATPGAAHDPWAGGVALVAEGLPAGAQVTVAGSFNGWDPNGPALRETRPGTYETWLPLEPGVHRL